MSAADRKAKDLTYAVRGVLLNERKERFLAWASQMWDADAVEICCSLLEETREAGFVQGIQGYAPETERDRHVEPQPWGEAGRGPGA